MARHFAAVRLAVGSRSRLGGDGAYIAFANHAGWWDPLIAFLASSLLTPDHTVYAPIDQAALRQYPIFERLGFFPIDLESPTGARQFLDASRQLLRSNSTAIWMTPEGRFTDVRESPAFRPGLSHLASRLEVKLVPAAVEYTFWEEKRPELLCEVGEPVCTADQKLSKSAWGDLLQQRLRQTQRSLAEKAIARRYEAFEVILPGSTGVGGVYDLFRRLRSMVTFQRFQPQHRRSDRPDGQSR